MPLRRLVLPGFIALYALVVLQNTWLHEDAFITYRSVDNLINGYGPTWNITERVQTYTHPLWFFVVSTAATPRLSARSPATKKPTSSTCSPPSTGYLSKRLKISTSKPTESI